MLQIDRALTKSIDRVRGAYYQGCMNAIAAAVEPLRQDAVTRARDYAQDLIIRTIGGQRACPELYTYPRAQSRRMYQEQLARYHRFEAITTAGALDPAKAAAFVQAAGEHASAQFDAFVTKLTVKVGPCASASLEGSHVWGYSTLTATAPDGTATKWRTQQIINVSSLGRPFNQWPTRRVKA